MMRKLLLPLVAAIPLMSGGCVAKAVWDVATLPVKAASQVVDWGTTSQAEADRNRGRKLRKADEKRGREERAAQKRAEAERKREEKARKNAERGDWRHRYDN